MVGSFVYTIFNQILWRAIMDRETGRLLCLIAIAFAAVTNQAAIFFPATVADLINDINIANGNNQDDIIDLSGQTFTLTLFNNNDNFEGFNGLPSILSDSGHSLTIQNGIIERNPAATGFRLIRIAPLATLFLTSLTLR